MAVGQESGSRGVFRVPPVQTPHEHALALARERSREVPEADLRALGADPHENGLVDLPVLESTLRIDRERGAVDVAGSPAPVELAVCALHYLSADLPNGAPPEVARFVSFRDIPVMRGYYAPYSGRVLGRITRQFGAKAADLGSAAAALGGRPEPSGDMGYRFDLFPRVPICLTYFLGDDEFTPEANLLYSENITALLPPEDVIVMSELLAARLCGKQWADLRH
jgi:hypothetical protein